MPPGLQLLGRLKQAEDVPTHAPIAQTLMPGSYTKVKGSGAAKNLRNA